MPLEGNDDEPRRRQDCLSALGGDIDFPTVCRCETEVSKRDLGRCERARHQEFVAELDFVNLYAEAKIPAPPQAHGTDWRRPVVKLLEQGAQCMLRLLQAADM